MKREIALNRHSFMNKKSHTRTFFHVGISWLRMWEQLHNTGPLLKVHLVARLARKWMKEREITHVHQDSFHCTFQDKSRVIKTCPIIGEHVVIIFVKVFMATVLPVKNTLDTDGELFYVIKPCADF